jgi:DNA-binding transcriptional regulator YhcF (GntR family)
MSDKRPKYLRVRDELIEDIKSGKLACGDRLPVRSVLLEKYSVTRTTLDKALGELIGKGILKSSKRGGTVVAASSFKPKVAVVSSLKRDVIMEAKGEPGGLKFLGAMIAGGEGLQLDFFDADFVSENFKILSDYDWIVWFQPDAASQKRLESANLDTVFVNRYFDDKNFVSTNHRRAFREVAELFFRHTGKNPQCFFLKAKSKDGFVSSERMEGFIEACGKADNFYRICELPSSDYDDVMEFLQALPLKKNRDVIVVSSSNNFTGAVVNFAASAGLELYKNFFYSDVDNYLSLERLGVRITSIIQDYHKMGELLSSALREGPKTIRLFSPHHIQAKAIALKQSSPVSLR